MTDEELYFSLSEKTLDSYTVEETIERLKKNLDKSITLQEWLDSQNEFDKFCEEQKEISPEEWEEAVAWAQEYLKDFKLCGE